MATRLHCRWYRRTGLYDGKLWHWRRHARRSHCDYPRLATIDSSFSAARRPRRSPPPRARPYARMSAIRCIPCTGSCGTCGGRCPIPGGSSKCEHVRQNSQCKECRECRHSWHRLLWRSSLHICNPSYERDLKKRDVNQTDEGKLE